jgi:hypothetical protein
VWGRVDREGSVSTAPRHGLDGPGIESRWGARFSACVCTCPGANPASCTGDTGSLSRGVGSRAVELWRLSPTPSSAEVEERVKLYVCSLCVLGWTLFCFHNITFPLSPLNVALGLTVVWEMTHCSLVAPYQPYCHQYLAKYCVSTQKVVAQNYCKLFTAIEFSLGGSSPYTSNK